MLPWLMLLWKKRIYLWCSREGSAVYRACQALSATYWVLIANTRINYVYFVRIPLVWRAISVETSGSAVQRGNCGRVIVINAT
jgi:hypothetical protein